MIRPRFIGMTLAAVLAAGLPAASLAQTDPVTGPEGVDWTLTSYLDPGSSDLVSVPYGLQPTLRLDAGIASGTTGCNRFEGGYEIDGTSLRISQELSLTLALCDEQTQLVEDRYLAALGEVDGWILDAGMLELSDDFGDVVLTFEVPDIGWTASQMAGLMATLDDLTTRLDAASLEIETLREQADSQNVVRLRQRIRALETENKELTKRLDALEQSPPSGGDGGGTTSSFSAREEVLLEGIPQRIAGTCAPLRASLPKNTQAAVACRPNSSAVSSLNYYLMEGDAAAAVYQSTMSTFNVPSAASETETCVQGVKSQRQWVGGGWQADGCYRTNERAEVRFIDNATDCRKLKVGNKTLQSPAIYMELQGSDRDIARVYQWATRGLDAGSGQLTSLTVPIERPDATLSPSCPT